MRKYNYIVSAAMLALCGYIFWDTRSWINGSNFQARPAFWPQFLAVLLAILSVALILETIFSKDPEMDHNPIDWKSPGMMVVYKMIGVMALFLVLMETLGMVIALLVIFPTIMYLMGCRNKKIMVILPVAVVGFIYIFFSVIMRVTLPEPFFL